MKKLILILFVISSFCATAQTNWTNIVGAEQSKDTVGGKLIRTRFSNGYIQPIATPIMIKDSLKNYQQIQDGLISGGYATLGSGSVTIDTAIFRINKVNYTSLPRTFTGIANAPSGTQYYLIVYGVIGGTLDTLSGARDTIGIVPNNPINTVKINTILVGDGGVESSVVDLSGFAQLNGGNTFTGVQNFTGENLINVKGNDRAGHQYFDAAGNFLGQQQFLNLPSLKSFIVSTPFNNPPTPTISTQRALQIDFVDRHVKFFGTVEGLNPVNPQDFVTKAYGDANYLTAAPDTTFYRTVANSYSLASGQPRLSFTSPLVNTSNTISIPSATTSVSGHLTSTDWNTFNNKQNQDNLLDEISNLSGNGIIVRQTSNTATTRSIVGTTNRVTVTNGDGVSGNPTLTLPQDIHTTATPQFLRLGLGSAASASTNLLFGAGTTTISSYRMPNGVAPTTPVSGDWWSLTTGLRTQTFDGTNTKDVIFDKANILFGGTGVRAVTSNPVGDLVAATPILSIVVLDSDVITAITGATYLNNRATITPAGGKVFTAGQIYDDGTVFTYIAIADNVVRRF